MMPRISTMLRIALWACLAPAIAMPPLAARADDQASVLVTTMKPVRGSLPDIVTAYGTAAPAPGSAATLSLLRAGQVLQLAVEPGQVVRKGDRLLDFGADPAAVMAWDQAVSALALAHEERVHTAQLVSQQLATRAQLAQADKALADAQAALDALRREGGAKPLETLTAPFDGIVISTAVGQGDRVQPGTALLTLARIDSLGVSVGVEPGNRAKLQPDQKVHLEPLGDGSPAADGTVHTVGGMLDPKTRLIDAFITVPPGGVLVGESFRAAITVGELQGWLVPRNAVLSDGQGAYVFQVADGKAIRVAVSIVGMNSDTTVVDGPLDPQRPLVTQGNYQLANGAAVREDGKKS